MIKNSRKTFYSLVALSALLSAPLLLAARLPHETTASTVQGSRSPNTLQSSDTNAANVRKIGGSVLPPAILYKVEPKFPDSLLKLNATCQVVLNLYVEPNGIPSNVHVIRTRIFDANGNEIPNPELTEEGQELMKLAVEAVNQDKFKPATENNIPVKVAVKIEVKFLK
jgi:hypothetical protein